MSGLLEIALGIVTSIGGFLDVGTIATSAEAGASFGFQLLWVLALGTLCVTVLCEMTGRLAAVSHHTLADAIRDRFGFSYHVIPLVAEVLVDTVVLSAEIGGVAVALELVTGISFNWWAIPAGVLVWFLLWKATFGFIEDGVAMLGLITISFVVAAYLLAPSGTSVLKGLIPSLPRNDSAHYWFVAVSLLGSLISPYVPNFYSSGAVEEKWQTKDLWVNTMVSTVGMSFGAAIAVAVLISAAMVLHPAGIKVDSYQQAALAMVGPLGKPGLYLFAASLFIACLGAALQVALNISYTLAQGLGWKWSENLAPGDDARFAVTYTIAVLVGSLVMFVGFDPLKVTMIAMALNVLAAPLVVLPLIVIMNNPSYLHEHTNGPVLNLIVVGVIVLAFVVSLVAIPLEIFGG